MVSGVTATIGENIIPCPTFTVIVANAGSSSSGGTKYPNLSGYCSINPSPINITSDGSQSTVCVTPYIYDANNICNSGNMDFYTKITVNGNVAKEKTTKSTDIEKNTTACLTHKDIISSLKGSSGADVTSGSYKMEATTTVSCVIDTEPNKGTYKLIKTCESTINYGTGAGSGSGSGNITASCRGTKLSAGKVRFSVTASSSDCSVSNLKYN